MNNTWKKIQLKDVADIVGGGTPSTKNPSYWNGEVAWLTPKDLSGYMERCISRGERNISREGLNNSSAILLPKGTVLLTSRAPIGYVAIANNPLSTNQGFKSLILKKGQNPLFYYYLLKANVEYIQNMGSGSTFKEVSGGVVKELTFLIPEYEEQKRIAEILGSLDDKIELLQKQNKTLEDMAKALFKSWFVDFDVVRAKQKGLPKADIMREYHLTEELYDLFPFSFADSPLGPIPSGWETSNLDSLCIRCQSGGTPSTKHAEYWENAVIDWFSTKELQDSFLLNSEKTISEEGLNNSSAKLFPKGTIIMAIYASPTVGRLGILTQEATFNQAAVGFIPKEDKISREYLFLMLKHRRDDLNNLANGAAQQNLSVGVVKAFNILIPNAALNTVYKRIVSPLFNKMEFNVKQIQTLTELRDTLLPRLISGKIRV